MKKFRFVILGAGNIADRFYRAAMSMEECEVTAVASKSLEKAQKFASQHGMITAYEDYQEMLEKEKPDCAYIAVIPSSHYELTMLCLRYGVPVICEKAMFMNKAEAQQSFEYARKQNLFVMEAMWSRFLPAVRQAKQWVREGKIGDIQYCEINIGFRAPKDPQNRYYNQSLGGGTRYDLLVYTYELTTFFMEVPIKDTQVSAVWGETDVDITTHVTLKYDHAIASMTTSFEMQMQEYMTLYGEKGIIQMRHPHYADEVILYDQDWNELERFADDQKWDGFVYEIREVIRCIREGKIESEAVPHQCTIQCAELFDQIEKLHPNC